MTEAGSEHPPSATDKALPVRHTGVSGGVVGGVAGHPPSLYSSVAVFLLGAIALVVPSGYSVGALMLSLAGLTIVVRPSQWPAWRRSDLVLMGVMAAFFAAWALEILLDGQPASRFDKPSRVLFALAALFWLCRHPPHGAAFWGGAAAGATAAGAWALWQRVVDEAARADGHTHMIQFGNIAMLLGLLSLTGLGWAWGQTHRGRWCLVLLLGTVMGMMASLLSGTRGGWIGVPFVLLVLAHAYRSLVPVRWMLVAGLAVATLTVVAYTHPGTGVQTRVHEAVSEVRGYAQGQPPDTSVGARLEMWRMGWLIVSERPFWSLGDRAFQRARDALVAEGRVAPQAARYSHLHNEYLDVLVKRGVFGLLALLALYLVPLRLFSRQLADNQPARQPYAAAGSVLCVAYIDFGMTQTFMSHNSGVMMFFFFLVVIWSLTTASAPARTRAGPCISG